jgi:hypothetical protein
MYLFCNLIRPHNLIRYKPHGYTGFKWLLQLLLLVSDLAQKYINLSSALGIPF